MVSVQLHVLRTLLILLMVKQPVRVIWHDVTWLSSMPVFRSQLEDWVEQEAAARGATYVKIV